MRYLIIFMCVCFWLGGFFAGFNSEAYSAKKECENNLPRNQVCVMKFVEKDNG